MKNYKKILILGSGALKIGEAGEFDYSGSQAIKALKEDGIKTVLINPNIATFQTSKNMADEVYFLPVNEYFIERVIEKEKPDGVIISFGGQTALNTGMKLHKKGVFKKHGVTILGTSIESVIIAEDRQLFANHLRKIGLPTPQSTAAESLEDAKKIAEQMGFPLMIRAGYTLGGQKSGVVFNMKELQKKVSDALAFAPQVLVEKYLHHFKEVEYEVVRDKHDNCVAVCNMENMDPLGIHTGESIVVAPSQTLTNFEYHFLRIKAIELVRSLNIVGECNVQFALNPYPSKKSPLLRGVPRRGEVLSSQNTPPQSHSAPLLKEGNDQQIDYYIIELNPRLSRSSALASKATGYPLAYVAAKLILGKSLTDVKNHVTQVTQSCFEPALDYLVVKIPRWDLEKFQGVEEVIGSSMKSVGEIMAIGRSFEEAIQKAVRMLDIERESITDNGFHSKEEALEYIKKPTPKRLFALCEALRRDISVEKIYEITGIDPWFLHRLKNIVDAETNISPLLRGESGEAGRGVSNKMSTPRLSHSRHPSYEEGNILDHSTLLNLKQLGFSDKKIGSLVGKKGLEIRALRKKLGILPSVFRIDTLAGEVPAKTNYLYTTYHGFHHDVEPIGASGVVVLGSGPYRIGSSVEFDWSSVNAAMALKKYKKKSIVINCNPETVSTDYDMSERLYFEELSFERVADIYEFENPDGVVVSVGGQRPNNLAKSLSTFGFHIYGTHADDIDRAEDRNKFSKLCDDLGVFQPEWTEAENLKQAAAFAERVHYPVLIRPSYVLSGSAMRVCFNEDELKKYLGKAAIVNQEHPVTISKFYEKAKEIELDGVSQHGEIKVFAVAEHIEHAGVHSGDATIVYPPERIYLRTQKKVIDIAKRLAKGLKITGPFNIQFLAKEDEVYVIEINLRASRSFPFISKAIDVNLAEVAVDSFFGKAKQVDIEYPDYSVIKSSQFSFARLEGADPILRVEMSATGEVACFGGNFRRALIKSIFATGVNIREKTALLTVGGIVNKKRFLQSAIELQEMGYTLYSTSKTYSFLKANGINIKKVFKLNENKHPDVVDLINDGKVSLVINISDKAEESKRDFNFLVSDGYRIRRAAIDKNIPLFTDLRLAVSFIDAISHYNMEDLDIKSWREYLKK